MRIEDMRRLIREVLEPKGLYSENAEELLILTTATESLGGHYLYQVNGPARGFFQMEPLTERDLLKNYVFYKPELREAVKQFVKFETDGSYSYRIHNPLTYSLEYQVIMARIHYLRRPGAIPNKGDIPALAQYWKKHYNTYLGKGDPKVAEVKYLNYVRG